ncbi:MAG: hypothetical protein K1X71_03885 [Pirellulales bacterium]|nr:hypothetical protein [Pirellulales bacterium]
MTAQDRLTRAISEVLGYLNFSSGASDPKFLANLNLLFEHCVHRPADQPTWRQLGQLLSDELTRLKGTSAAFNDISQAAAVLSLVNRLLIEYQSFHCDLLGHLPAEELFRPFFIGRAMEAILAQAAPWEESDRIVAGALRQLNDYVGYRPVAILHSGPMEPYPHERVRPVPLFVAGAGVDTGRYLKLIEQTLALLRAADESLLREAGFNPDLLDELAFDPRAFDFDHPASKRPNYQFGLWDPHHLDNAGRYRRFVVQQVALDALLAWVNSSPDEQRTQRLFEAAVALAGIILMASAVSGGRPDAHDSSVTLATLLPRIARNRDVFYKSLLACVEGAHGERLQAEAARLRQPFGAVRQHLNYQLARCRAQQLQHVHLAMLFSRIGYPEAARRQAQAVPVASARLRCEIQIRLIAAQAEVARGELSAAGDNLSAARDLLSRGIACGALIDPWNILGFQGNFSIFSALENTIHDHRVDDLLELVRQMFQLYARLQCRAAIAGDNEANERLSTQHRDLAEWWDRFATLDISGLEHIAGRAGWQSTQQVAGALAAARAAGEAANQVAWWREHLVQAQSAKAYALLAESLIDGGRRMPAMALLVQWASQHARAPLAERDHAFAIPATRWVQDVLGQDDLESLDRWRLIQRFFDFLEANAEDLWNAPTSAAPEQRVEVVDVEDEEVEADGPTFQAAYEGMVYRDSAADGNEGSLIESQGGASESEFNAETERLGDHLAYLSMIARLWRALAASERLDSSFAANAESREVLAAWHEHALATEQALTRLLQSVYSRSIPSPESSRESLLDFDRLRMAQLSLMDRVAGVVIDWSDARRWLTARLSAGGTTMPRECWQDSLGALLGHILRRDAVAARPEAQMLCRQLGQLPLLYRPLATGGAPDQVLRSQQLQRSVADVVTALPRLGLIQETCDLLKTSQNMEMRHPVGRGAVSEFDRLFRLGLCALVQSVVDASQLWAVGAERAERLVECLEPLTEKLLKRWLLHSRSLRLSVLEKVAEPKQWDRLVEFIQRYGDDLFTQSFFHVGNLRGILQQGVESWLVAQQDRDDDDRWAILDDLDGRMPRSEAAEHIELICEAILEHYGEYKDYNHIATQSDKGGLLYILLDFLRLKVRYERVLWNLRPVLFTHEVLVGSQLHEAAEIWQRGFRGKTEQAADWHLRRLAELERKFGIRLPSVADRIAERFVAPLVLDRMRALLRVSATAEDPSERSAAFASLEQELERFTQDPTGSGLELPSWLHALEREAGQAIAQRESGNVAHSGSRMFSQIPLTYDEVMSRIDAFDADAE